MLIEFAIIIFGLLWLLHFQRTKALPHGPFSVPIFGTLDIFINPASATGIVFNEKYFCFKELCTFFLGPTLVLVLINDYKLAKELFNKDEFSGKRKKSNFIYISYLISHIYVQLHKLYVNCTLKKMSSEKLYVHIR